MLELNAFYTKSPTSQSEIYHLTTCQSERLTFVVDQAHDYQPTDPLDAGNARLMLYDSPRHNIPVATVTGQWIGTTAVFHLENTWSVQPGIYQWAVACDSPNGVKYLMRGLAEVTAGPNDANKYTGITIADVRMAMWDICPTDNILLDDLEFPEDMIAAAIRHQVDVWNETPPTVICYTPSNFPYRAHLLKGVCGYLLQTAGRRMTRNGLDYSAAGVQQNDSAKTQLYLQQGEKLQQEFTAWMMQTKREINFNDDTVWVRSEISQNYRIRR